ncbi:MAG TPA: hypothetical protein VFV81_02375 [Verrucomicrobiae bacterium]|nr:hypothetical protein [Verrucomicrobiae bacterium]
MSRQCARRLKVGGTVVLVAGIAAAALLYWVRTRSPDPGGDLSMLGFDKPQRRQMELLYGKSGALMHEWLNDLKQPGTQAVLILVITLLIAAILFYFGRLLDFDEPSRGPHDR